MYAVFHGQSITSQDKSEGTQSQNVGFNWSTYKVETMEKVRRLGDGHWYTLTVTILSFIFPHQRYMEASTPWTSAQV